MQAASSPTTNSSSNFADAPKQSPQKPEPLTLDTSEYATSLWPVLETSGSLPSKDEGDSDEINNTVFGVGASGTIQAMNLRTLNTTAEGEGGLATPMSAREPSFAQSQALQPRTPSLPRASSLSRAGSSTPFDASIEDLEAALLASVRQSSASSSNSSIDGAPNSAAAAALEAANKLEAVIRATTDDATQRAIEANNAEPEVLFSVNNVEENNIAEENAVSSVVNAPENAHALSSAEGGEVAEEERILAEAQEEASWMRADEDIQLESLEDVAQLDIERRTNEEDDKEDEMSTVDVAYTAGATANSMVDESEATELTGADVGEATSTDQFALQESTKPEVAEVPKPATAPLETAADPDLTAAELATTVQEPASSVPDPVGVIAESSANVQPFDEAEKVASAEAGVSASATELPETANVPDLTKVEPAVESLDIAQPIEEVGEVIEAPLVQAGALSEGNIGESTRSREAEADTSTAESNEAIAANEYEPVEALQVHTTENAVDTVCTAAEPEKMPGALSTSIDEVTDPESSVELVAPSQKALPIGGGDFTVAFAVTLAEKSVADLTEAACADFAATVAETMGTEASQVSLASIEAGSAVVNLMVNGFSSADSANVAAGVVSENLANNLEVAGFGECTVSKPHVSQAGNGDTHPSDKSKDNCKRGGNQGAGENGDGGPSDNVVESVGMSPTMIEETAQPATLFDAPEAAAAEPATSPPLPSATSSGLAAGLKVESRFGGKAKYYGATIGKANDDGTYEVMYDDGDVETAVAREMICTYARAGEFSAGEKIEARFGGKNKFYGGRIVKDNGDGTYEVHYDDGDVEKEVKFIRKWVVVTP